MKRLETAKYLTLACGVLVAGSGTANAGPILTGETKRDECRQAFAIAKAQYRSDSHRLMAPLTLPAGLQSKLILRVDQEDISGGDAQIADTGFFEKKTVEDDNYTQRRVYRQAVPVHGKRLAVAERSVGWRGDLYNTYLVNVDVRPDDLMLDPHEAKQRGLVPIVDDSWWPLQIFRDNRTGSVWAIGQTAETRWDIYVVDEAGMSVRCKVTFMPEKVHKAVYLLPADVQKFSALLEEALGPETFQGTSHPTLRILLNAERGWFDVLYRPWALTDSIYNTRDEVDAGLAEWSKVSLRRQNAHHALKKYYGLAELALAAHYRASFGLSPERARRMAAYATDHMYRSHFSFPSARGRAGWEPSGAANPWTVQKEKQRHAS